MKGLEAIEIVGDLASQQSGLLTAAQAKTEGLDLPTLRRMANRDQLTRIRHGVYAIAGTPMTPDIETMAQWLALSPAQTAADRLAEFNLKTDAVVSYTSAAEMWKIGTLWPDGIHFTTQRRKRSRQQDVHFHRDTLAKTEYTTHPSSGLPITTVARTIADLADGGHEPGYLEELISDAANNNLVSKEELLQALSGKEAAFGLNEGDSQSLHKLLDEHFPSDTLAAPDFTIEKIQEIFESSTKFKQLKADVSEITKAIEQQLKIAPPTKRK